MLTNAVKHSIGGNDVGSGRILEVCKYKGESDGAGAKNREPRKRSADHTPHILGFRSTAIIPVQTKGRDLEKQSSCLQEEAQE